MHLTALLEFLHPSDKLQCTCVYTLVCTGYYLPGSLLLANEFIVLSSVVTKELSVSVIVHPELSVSRHASN